MLSSILTTVNEDMSTQEFAVTRLVVEMLRSFVVNFKCVQAGGYRFHGTSQFGRII